MKYVAAENGAFVCYLSETGRDRRDIGCRHAHAKEATAHTVPLFVPASRSGRRPLHTDVDRFEAPDRPADPSLQAGAGVSSAAQASDVEPVSGRALSMDLGL